MLAAASPRLTLDVLGKRLQPLGTGFFTPPVLLCASSPTRAHLWDCSLILSACPNFTSLGSLSHSEDSTKFPKPRDLLVSSRNQLLSSSLTVSLFLAELCVLNNKGFHTQGLPLIL